MARPSFLPKSINYNIIPNLKVTNLTVLNDLTVGNDVNITGDLSIDGNTTVNQLTAGTTTTADLTSSNLTVTSQALVTNFVENVSGVRQVLDSATSILTTDKVLLLRTSGAGGPYVITPTNLTNIHKVTIIMVAFNTSTFTFSCIQGTVTFGAIGDSASFVYYGTGTTWSLMGAPQGATVT